jgi:predicted RNA-binding Zn-ribbon protein involved in translation (DUF1610 family)
VAKGKRDARRAAKVRAARQAERELERAASVCPDCGNVGNAEILYGEVWPDAEMNAKAERGELTYGGCSVGWSSPAYKCPKCGCEFGEVRNRYR